MFLILKDQNQLSEILVRKKQHYVMEKFYQIAFFYPK